MKNRKQLRSNRGQRPSSSKRLSGVCAEIIEQRLLLSTYTVNTLSDATNPGAGLLTLRQAIDNANTNPGADTIAFDPTVFTPGTLHTITLTQGQITFTDTTGTTTITGPGSAISAVSGGGTSRVFQVNPQVIVAMSGLQIVNGKQTTADANGNTYGGGIDNAGTLTISNSVISNNEVDALGQFELDGQETAGEGLGGGIYSTGALTITGSQLTNNSVVNSAIINAEMFGSPSNTGAAFGGAIYSTAMTSLTSDTVMSNVVNGSVGGDFDNAGGPAAGGGIYVSAGLTITGSTISGNTATAGNASGYSGRNGGDASGGGIFAGGSLVITGSTIETNQITGGNSSFDAGYSGAVHGGGVDAEANAVITATIINGNSATAGETDYSNGISAGGGLYAASGATLMADTINGNNLLGGPGEIATDPFPDAGNPTTAGGGIYAGGPTQINQSSISGNTTTSHLIVGTSEYRVGGFNVGGGVAISAASTITNSSITGNSVVGGYGDDGYSNYQPTPGGDGDGGGVYNSSTLTITNSTIANNSATGGAGGDARPEFAARNGGNGNGGGIYTNASLTIFDSTITGNTAAAGQGGAAYVSSDPGFNSSYPAGAPGIATAGGIDIAAATTLLTNSILSDNTAAGKFNDIAGTANSKSANNLIGVGGGLTNGASGNKVGINNPMLSPLGNNGGPTHTMVPLPSSPALDAGNNSLIPSGITTDQRGLPRIVGKSVDIGATEFQASIFGTVFDDSNGNSKQDPSESGVPGVTVYIDTTNSGAFKSGDPKATTNSSGNYSFTGLVAGTYIVRQILPTGDNQISPANNFGNHVTVAAGQTVSSINFADQGPVIALNSVSGTLFNDANKNGKQDPTEPGLAGWTVFGDLNNNGKLDPGEASTTTGPTGQFFFDGLVPGAYIFRVIPPSGWTQTFPTNNFGLHVTVSSSTAVNNINFGFFQNNSAASISGEVFNDANGNGIQNSGKLGLSGWTVYIDLTNSGTLQSNDPTTTTDSSGDFTFNNLAAGAYIVRVISPTGWSQTLPTKNFGQHITLATGQKVNAILFGEKKT